MPRTSSSTIPDLASIESYAMRRRAWEKFRADQGEFPPELAKLFSHVLQAIDNADGDKHRKTTSPGFYEREIEKTRAAIKAEREKTV